MAKTDYRSVDEYLAAQPEPTRAALKHLRDIIKKAVPGAEELISYQIPAYRHAGGYFLYVSGWKEHYSLYPASHALVAALKDDIKPYLANKNTIRFDLSDPVPTRLIERIAKPRQGGGGESQGEGRKAQDEGQQAKDAAVIRPVESGQMPATRAPAPST